MPSKLPVVAKTRKCLNSHTNFVRPICWSYELPWLLLSSGWDSSICAWDVQVGACLHTVRHHLADVYGISTHPDRPFVYASCSRDTVCCV